MKSLLHDHLMSQMMRVIDMHSHYKLIQGWHLAQIFNMVHDDALDLDRKNY